METSTVFDRRSFLKGALAAGAVTTMGAAGAALTGCAPAQKGSVDSAAGLSGDSVTAAGLDKAQWSFEVPPDPVAEGDITKTYEADVIVVGSGVAGFVAAASALDHGGDVLLFSASTKPVSRGGSNNGVGTKVQKRLGVDYTPETITTHLKNELARSSYRVDQRKWWRWVNNSAESMDWLVDIVESAGYQATLELPFEDPDGTFSVPASSHNFYGDGIANTANEGQPLVMKALEQFIKSKGGDIHYSTTGLYLVRDDGNTGRVSAIVATDPDGNHVKYAARKAVVLATGDFSANKDMMARYCGNFADFVLPDLKANYDAEFQFGGLMPGDGHKMGLWAGAAWQRVQPCTPMIGWYGFPAPASDQNHTGILLNRAGKRFMNEDTTAVYAGYAVQAQPGMSVFSVWSASYARQFSSWEALGNNMDNLGVVPVGPEDKVAEWDAGVEEKAFFKADSIEGVLSQMEGIDVEAARAEIERYNALAHAGVDEDFRKDARYLAAIEEGPFYGAQSTMGSAQFLCVLGGLRTNELMQVCDEDDRPIEGLYNVGCMVGDSFANVYNFRIPGHNLGMNCITHAYLTGKGLASA